jgi:hypothetical protein
MTLIVINSARDINQDITVSTPYPDHHPPLQFATKNSRTLRKDLRDLRLFQPPDIVSLEAAVQNFSTQFTSSQTNLTLNCSIKNQQSEFIWKK